MAYHIVISSVDGSVLNSSLYRPGNAPDYVQKYMATHSISQTESESKNNNDKEKELHQQISCESSLRKIKDISQEDGCSENLKESFTEAQNVKDCVKEVTCFQQIYGPDGTVLETSFQRYNPASHFIQQYLKKKRGFGAPQTTDTWTDENKVCLRKHDVLSHKRNKPKNIERNDINVEKYMLSVNQNTAENFVTENPKQASNNSSRKTTVIMWVICLIGFPKTVKANECLESLSTLTLTPSCPATEKQWTEKVNLKKCSNYPQSCSSPNEFVYHCLINAFGNATVEVCAPRKRTSYCVEFNSLGARIQANFHTKCTNTTTDCGKFYDSNEMYKVPQCFSSIRDLPMPYNLSETKIPFPLQSTRNAIETTDSYTTVNQTGDSRYVDEVSKGAGNQLGYAMIGIIVIPTAVIVFTIRHYALIFIDQKCKRPQAKTKVKTCYQYGEIVA